MATAAVHVAGRVAERRVEAADGPQREVGGVDDEHGVSSDHGRAVMTLEATGAQAPDGHAVAGRVPTPEAREHHGGVHSQRAGEDDVKGGRRGVGPPLLLEQRRHHSLAVGLQGVPPPELVEGVVERLAGVAGACLGKAGPKELELLAVHYASAPRSSRRRATMLRWISALPP